MATNRRSKNNFVLPMSTNEDKVKELKEPRCWFCWLWPLFAAYASYSTALFLYPIVFPNSPSPFYVTPTPIENLKFSDAIVPSKSSQLLHSHEWFSSIFEKVKSSNDMLVHQPFFWTQLAQIADVRIGNWKKATKGFAKVADRTKLWSEVQEWEVANEGKTAIVFAKCSLCTLLAANRTNIKGPYIVMGTFNDNWGMLSNARQGIHQMQSLENMQDPRCGGSISQLEDFINDPRLLLWVVNHHVYKPWSGKVLSLPLGIKDRSVWDNAAIISRFPPKRTTQLELNNNEWRFRAALNQAVNRSFGHSLVNTYNMSFSGSEKPLTGADRKHITRVYLTRLASSKFVFCPPGLGMDSYRVYETLLLGSIPVIEASYGLDRSLAHLPVLFMKNLTYLTPAILDHVETLAQGQDWNFRKLTPQYWTSIITSVARTKQVEHIEEIVSDVLFECKCWFPYGHCLDIEGC